MIKYNKSITTFYITACPCLQPYPNASNMDPLTADLINVSVHHKWNQYAAPEP